MAIRMIAEHVENDQIVEKLQSAGVDHAYGYGMAKPASLK